MTKLEAVARAIVTFWGEDPDRVTVTGQTMTKETVPLARAAVEALREPSEGMIDAAWKHYCVSEKLFPAHFTDEWQAMIDAILKEGGE